MKTMPTDRKGAAGAPSAARAPTSQVLQDLLDGAPAEEVTLGWIIDQLRERSFGILLLIVALVALAPGASPIGAVLLAVMAIQMILARAEPTLPRFITKRRFAKDRLAKLFRRIIPALAWLERLIRPRWTTPFEATKRLIGLITLLLSVTLLVPIPFSHVIPAVVIMLLALAFLEEDGVLLSLALTAAALSFLFTAAQLWGAVETSLLA